LGRHPKRLRKYKRIKLRSEYLKTGARCARFFTLKLLEAAKAKAENKILREIEATKGWL
jgi:hypothetical protein